MAGLRVVKIILLTLIMIFAGAGAYIARQVLEMNRKLSASAKKLHQNSEEDQM